MFHNSVKSGIVIEIAPGYTAMADAARMKSECASFSVIYFCFVIDLVIDGISCEPFVIRTAAGHLSIKIFQGFAEKLPIAGGMFRINNVILSFWNRPLIFHFLMRGIISGLAFPAKDIFKNHFVI